MTSICKAGMGCLISYHLIDSGLADLLALETLAHGTGPLGYIGIHLHGADPSFGGSGSSRGNSRFQESSRGYFHVFKDSGFGVLPNGYTSFSSSELIMNKALLPKYHAVLSAGVCGIFTPTLKFRFTPQEVLGTSGRFENDPEHPFMAYKTMQPIEASRIGILGSLIHGINRGMFKRMANNPKKVLVGIGLLAAGILNLKIQFEKIATNSPVS